MAAPGPQPCQQTYVCEAAHIRQENAVRQRHVSLTAQRLQAITTPCRANRYVKWRRGTCTAQAIVHLELVNPKAASIQTIAVRVAVQSGLLHYEDFPSHDSYAMVM